MRARGPPSPTSCRLTGRTVAPEGREGLQYPGGSHLSAQAGGREGGRLLLQGKKRFSPVVFILQDTSN